MGIIIDILIALVLLICIFLGYKRGLVKVLVGLIAFIIALVVTVVLYKPIANAVIDNTKLDDNIKNTIYENIKDENLENSDNKIIQFANQYILPGMEEVTIEIVADSISETIIEVLTFMILLGIVRIALFFVSKIFDAITELPIIKQFNKLGGTIYGIAQGIVINYLVFAIIIVVVPMMNLEQVDKTINESTFGKVLYNENIIIKMIK